MSRDFVQLTRLFSALLKIKKEQNEVEEQPGTPTTIRCNAGCRCSFSVLVWSLVGCLLLLNLYSFISQKDASYGGSHLRINQHPHFRELEEVEEENIQLPPPRKRSPRAAKRKT
ncbi:hypothetical protein HAX54_016864 [Datura stramonium]|uniref:Uncharacterized protein n=1 Tax=Datura stramonium TaxID=4076 RepID=A0ABS8RKG9_DATST|nr:hypothetical protein [Datura stramonium]